MIGDETLFDRNYGSVGDALGEDLVGIDLGGDPGRVVPEPGVIHHALLLDDGISN